MKNKSTIQILLILLIVGLSTECIIGNTDYSQDEIDEAKTVVCRFYGLLSEGSYTAASKLFAGDYRFHISCSSDVDPSNHEALWRAACGRCGLQCLEIREIEYKSSLLDAGMRFEVKYSTQDGELFIMWPCCGESEEESPPDSLFHVDVRKYESGYLVETIPVFIP